MGNLWVCNTSYLPELRVRICRYHDGSTLTGHHRLGHEPCWFRDLLWWISGQFWPQGISGEAFSHNLALCTAKTASHHCVWPPLRVGSQHMKRRLCDGLDWGLKVRQQLPQTHLHMFKSMSSSTFTELCNYWYHHNPILDNCHLPKRIPHACWQLIAIPTAGPRSVCMLCVLLFPPLPGPQFISQYTLNRGVTHVSRQKTVSIPSAIL